MHRSAFAPEEFSRRLGSVRREMDSRRLDLLLLSDPCNIYYLTGYDGWSFYTLQLLAVPLAGEPLWIGRQMDVEGVLQASILGPEQVAAYPDAMVQSTAQHPCDLVAERLRDRGWHRGRIGVEKGSYYLGVDAFERLAGRLANARWQDASQLVNWVRFVKSPAELAVMREAAAILDVAMQAGVAAAVAGAREADVVSAICAAQVAGKPGYAGLYTSTPPLVVSGPRTATPHLPWTDGRLEPGQQVNIEISGNRLRYQVPMGRTVWIGEAPRAMVELEEIVLEAIAAVLGRIRPGVTCEDVAHTLSAVLARHGIAKDSRCGYSIGIAYPPTGGELTASLRAGDRTELHEGCTLHFLPAIWSRGRSIVLSEPLVVTANGAERLSRFPQRLLGRG